MSDDDKDLSIYETVVKVMSTQRHMDVFWDLIDSLSSEYQASGEGFYCNRKMILEAFIDGRCLIQEITETDHIYNNKRWLYRKTWSLLVVPSICVLDYNGDIDIIWTEEYWRGSGIARKYIEHVKPTSISNVLPKSVGFWNAMGIPILNVLR